MNAKKNLRREYGTLAYDLYVREGLTVAAIAERTGVNSRTIYRWRDEEKWDEDKEKRDKSVVSLEASLDKAVVSFKAELDSCDPERVKEAIELLDKVTRIRERINSTVDRLPVALDLIDDLVNFARVNAPRELAEPIIDIFMRWADDVRRRYKEAAK